MTAPRDIPARRTRAEAADVTPAGEEIHMPEPSALPLINAAALAIAIVSITISWWLVAGAAIVFLGTAIKWIGDVRRDVSNLPLDHSHH